MLRIQEKNIPDMFILIQLRVHATLNYHKLVRHVYN